MFNWFKKSTTTVSCVECISCSDKKWQSPLGPMLYYCLHSKNANTKFSHVENKDTTKYHPCKYYNGNGLCQLYETKNTKTNIENS